MVVLLIAAIVIGVGIAIWRVLKWLFDDEYNTEWTWDWFDR